MFAGPVIEKIKKTSPILGIIILIKSKDLMTFTLKL
jgi:hypothetical protein